MSARSVPKATAFGSSAICADMIVVNVICGEFTPVAVRHGVLSGISCKPTNIELVSLVLAFHDEPAIFCPKPLFCPRLLQVEPQLVAVFFSQLVQQVVPDP